MSDKVNACNLNLIDPELPILLFVLLCSNNLSLIQSMVQATLAYWSLPRVAQFHGSREKEIPQGAFTMIGLRDGQEGGQRNANKEQLDYIIKVQTRVHPCSKNVKKCHVICETSLTQCFIQFSLSFSISMYPKFYEGPQNDHPNLSFVKDINVVGDRMTRNGHKMTISKSCLFKF